MDQQITLKIGEITLAVESEEYNPAAIKQILQRAMQIFVLRLTESPFGRSIDPVRLALQKLELEPLSVQELLGARGAERLANELYNKLVGVC